MPPETRNIRRPHTTSARPHHHGLEQPGTTLVALAALAAAVALSGCGDGAGAATPESTCPAVDGTSAAPTRHAGTITTDETWTAAGSPHVVDGTVELVGGARLVIEPCAIVELTAGASLHVGRPDGTELGALVAEGAATKPIVVRRAGASAWGAIVVDAPSTVSLAHVTLRGGGADDDLQGATLVARGENRTPIAQILATNAVRIEGSRGPGALLDRAAGFTAGSTGLVVVRSGDALGLAPIVAGLHAAGTIPAGDYSDNSSPEIELLPDSPNDLFGLQQDVHLRDRGVPYRFGRTFGDDLRVGANGGPLATLTIDAGVEVRFISAASLRVVADEEGPTGALRVLGTRERPVIFASASATPSAGDWAGLYFEAPMAATNELTHVYVRHAGGSCSCSLASCSPVDGYEAAVIFDGAPPSAFIRDSIVEDSAGHGFLRSWLDQPELDFLATNHVASAFGCAQTMPLVSGESCPSETYACE